MNILLTYLYRDAANYKHWGEVVFTNSDGLDPAALEAAVRRWLIDRNWFVAEDVIVPDLRPEERDDELDHDWHEFHSLSVTSTRIDDPAGRDVQDWIRDLRKALRSHSALISG